MTGKDEIVHKKQVSCYLTYTTEETHKIIRANLDRSPIYTANQDMKLKSTGPRYCPSIEDKVVRFADKKKTPIIYRAFR